MQELWVSPHPKRRDNVPEWWTCPCLFSLYPFTASFSTGHLHSGLPCGEPGQAGFALHREKLAALQNKQIRGAFQETHLATSQATLFRSALWVNEADILISGLPPGVTTQFVSSSKVENRHILFWPPQPPTKDRDLGMSQSGRRSWAQGSLWHWSLRVLFVTGPLSNVAVTVDLEALKTGFVS